MKKSTALNTLLDIALGPTGMTPQINPCALPGLDGLHRKNGFFAFESALEVFPIGECQVNYSFCEWNRSENWRSHYHDLNPEGLCFAQDVFGTQFLIADKIYSFDPETGQTTLFGESLEVWAEQILTDFEVLTGQPIAHAWQSENGPIPKGSRLVPITPFVLGGAYDINNLVAMDAVTGMRLRAALALQIRDLPDGTEVIYEIK